MTQQTDQPNSVQGPILVLGATGKTGSRVLSRLEDLNWPARAGSRKADPAFDWMNPATWDACLENISAVYVNYASDLPIPGSADIITAFMDKALHHSVQHVVLLTGRGEPEARVWEDIIQESGLNWTVVRSSWFQQNFTEGGFASMVEEGQIVLPAGNTPEPFIDLDDLADVVVTALTQPGHIGQLYEITGPRLLTFAEVADVFSHATGRTVTFQNISLDVFLDEMKKNGVPEEVIWLMDYLFGRILDGRNTYVTDTVQQVLGRPPKDFTTFAQETFTAKPRRLVA